MLIKNSIGILIILLNIGGICYLLYVGVMTLVGRFFHQTAPKEPQPAPEKPAPKAEKAPPKEKKMEPIMSEEDDLLKDMDLSDLDNLNLDDFE